MCFDIYWQRRLNYLMNQKVATELVRRGGFTNEFIATNARIRI